MFIFPFIWRLESKKMPAFPGVRVFGPLFTNEICLWHHRLCLAGDSIFLCTALEGHMFVCVHLSLYHVGTHECIHVFLWWHHFVFFLRQDLTLAWRSLSRWGCLGCEPQGFRTSPPSHRWDYTYILIYTGFCCPCHCLFSMDSGTHTPVLTLAQQTLQQPSYLSIPEWSHNLLSLLERFFHLYPFMPMWFVPA